MPDADDLEPRVRRLEDDMSQLRPQVARAVHDSAAARVLAGGADRDVSEVRTILRAHTQALNALRETQLDDRAWATARFAEVNEQLEELRRGLGTVHVGVAQITALLTNMTDDG